MDQGEGELAHALAVTKETNHARRDGSSNMNIALSSGLIGENLISVWAGERPYFCRDEYLATSQRATDVLECATLGSEAIPSGQKRLRIRALRFA